ncbi:hypothetical protein BC567DRAFT_252891, partial [Phyllosticta citribraziliensis]
MLRFLRLQTHVMALSLLVAFTHGSTAGSRRGVDCGRGAGCDRAEQARWSVFKGFHGELESCAFAWPVLRTNSCSPCHPLYTSARAPAYLPTLIECLAGRLVAPSFLRRRFAQDSPLAAQNSPPRARKPEHAQYTGERFHSGHPWTSPARGPRQPVDLASPWASPARGPRQPVGLASPWASPARGPRPPWGLVRPGASSALGPRPPWGLVRPGASSALGPRPPWGLVRPGASSALGPRPPWGLVRPGASSALGPRPPWGLVRPGASSALGPRPPWGLVRPGASSAFI